MSSELIKRPLDGTDAGAAPDDESSDPRLKRLRMGEVDVESSSSLHEPDAFKVGDVQKGKKKRGNVGPRESRRDRRGTRGTRNTEDGVTSDTTPVNGDKRLRLPKRNCALLIGFCGTGCNGMQIQPNVRTIEGVLFEAMVKVGAVSQDNADDPVKVGLARAARTDAGVHAAGNIVSIKMITIIPGVRDIVARINEELPPEIRLWSFQRTQNSFNAHTGLAQIVKTGNQELGCETSEVIHSFWKDVDLSESSQADLERKRKWRIEREILDRFKAIMSMYLGSHNFHNFTIGKEFSDRSNYRHMKRIERKMVCVAVLACRTNTPPDIIDTMYGPSKVIVPKAPALGLLLERPLFESYNRKVKEANEKLSSSADPAYRSIIDFDPHQDMIEQFKQDQIYSRMRAQEGKEATFDAWIRSIDTYSGRDLLYLNQKGVIPPSIVLNKGERRPNPFREKKRFDATGPLTLDNIEDDEDENMDASKLSEMEG
ncbi:hypothetical protein Clacol_007772 [Clathrus columnatus]|uniref:Uncharacterized protein n=1 Tax=Clathrus columnatus TaxID=1419009 RepID=A0AAV5AJ30_9AGAM|nr:hypothetical protein Clacol_007772 [Clathrus columnatus]